MSTRSERLTFGHGVHPGVPTRTAAAAKLAHEPTAVRLTRLQTWDWGWGGLLLFTLLLYFRPQDQIAALGALHIADIAALIGLSAMFFLRLSRGESPTRVTPELFGIAALGIAVLLSVPTSIWPGGSVGVFTDKYIQIALIFMLIVNTVTSPRRIERITWIIVLAFGLVSARAWFDYARGVNLVEGHRVAGGAGGFFENPNDLALNLVAFLPLALMYVKRPGPAFKRVFSAVIVLLMLGALVFTKSRSGMVGAGVMVMVFLVVSRSLTPATIIAGVLSTMLVTPMLPQSFWERMSSIVNEDKDETGSREARRVLLEQAWQIFLEHPVTGVGAGQFMNYGEPGRAEKWRVTHNAVLEVASELGMIGLVPFIFLVVRGFTASLWTRSVLLAARRRRPRRRGTAPPEPEDGLEDRERVFLETTASALVASLAGWFVCAMFASVAFTWTFYYLLGLAVCARDVVLARAQAYEKAKVLTTTEVVLA